MNAPGRAHECPIQPPVWCASAYRGLLFFGWRMPRKSLPIRKKIEARGVLPHSMLTHAQPMMYFLHSLISRRAFARGKQRRTGWIPYHSEILRAELGRRAVDEALPLMVASSLIERDEHYVPGSSSMSYRMSPELLRMPTAPGKIYDRPLINRIEKSRQLRLQSYLPEEQYMISWAQRAGIDAPAAMIALDGLGLEPHQHECALEAIDAIVRRDWGLMTICRYGRLHTWITRMKRELREYITLDGAGGLVELDISSAQPLLMGGTCRRELGWRPPDVEKFIKLCEDGDLYLHLTAATDWTGAIGEWKSDVWFAFLFGANRSNAELSHPENEYLARLCHHFAAEFPNLWEWMWQRREGTGWRTLSTDMQRAESDLMIRGLGRHLMRDHPHIGVLTIHDGAMVHAQHADTLRDLIRQLFEGVGLRPRIPPHK